MRLSICIPTFNRAAYLPVLLDSILAQSGFECDLEIAISDNGSIDDTVAVVNEYRRKFAQLVFHREPENRGADYNFLKVVEIATGDFCWLMGSDDVLEPGGVQRVETMLLANPELAGLAVKNNSYDVELRQPIASAIKSDLPARSGVFTGSESIFLIVGEYISFLSANVVRRDLWMMAARESGIEAYFNAWIHVYVIGRMMQRRQHWGYIAEPCVGWRSGNDSFLADGHYRRLEIDVAGYDRILRGLFGDGSKVHQRIMGRILNHARFRILHAKAHGAPASFFDKAAVLMGQHYKRSPAYWLTVYPIMQLPSPFFKFVRAVYVRTLKRIRTAAAGR